MNVSARNFDFFTAGDGVIRFNPAGTAGQAQYTPPNCQPLKWTRKYASVTFNLTIAKTKSPNDGDYEAVVFHRGKSLGQEFFAFRTDNVIFHPRKPKSIPAVDC